MAKYRLLAIDGPKSWEWLPWDGKTDRYVVPVEQDPKDLWAIANPSSSYPELKTARYYVWDIGNFLNDTHRYVYVHEDVASPELAELMLKDHLLELFIEVGDLENESD